MVIKTGKPSKLSRLATPILVQRRDDDGVIQSTYNSHTEHMIQPMYDRVYTVLVHDSVNLCAVCTV